MKSLFKNCISVKEENGWFTPLRFTKAQNEIYSLAEWKRIRCVSPASVCIAFKTQAEKISFEYRITAKARSWALFDLVCDGVLEDSVTVNDDNGRVEFSLSGNPKVETRIYLPHLVCIDVRNIESDAPLIPVSDKEKFWLALGDSITQGMVAKHPAFAYPSVVSHQLGYDLLNAGVGGIVFDANELDFVGKEPDLITIALGANDWGTFNREQLTENVGKYLERLINIYRCRNIYGILPIWRSDEGGEKCGMTFSEHREAIKEVYQKYQFIKIIDGYKLVPKLVEFYGDPGEIKLHPDDKGLLLYSSRLIEEITNN